ncbi:TIGR03808 family TAT-translocated repetitive protein [Devosia nitrariae]|uniref:Tat protein n=1 Tax=Devosia nitrariae TaxID=2071872 RepID=A0ABQ5W4N1_9HYPH|nr:TIGR03808 family TAT-translocated repetitive protein [Devosia nitrariae]GLQ55014.1 Tat protein [Devosia nitrariae]
MRNHTRLSSRRQFLAFFGGAMLAAPALHPSALMAQTAVSASEFGLVPDTGLDQSAAFQAAIDAAANQGLPLLLPAGTIRLRDIALSEGLVIQGVRGRSFLAALDEAPIARIAGVGTITLSDIGFDRGSEPFAPDRALLEIESATDIGLYRCSFRNGEGSGVRIHDAQVVIDDCVFARLGDAAIHAMDSRGLTVTGCRIDQCGNAGIRVWRSEIGEDASIIMGNRISDIGWSGGGNGQNGNGVNVFRAGGVIVADNHISDCAFTAVRLNGSRNTQVTGNVCRDCGEVAIFSEFEFSGSVISDNIVDGAAAGISITNLDRGGQLAVCSGNIVRNIAPFSPVNPDVSPYGIYAEAETVISGNAVEGVPGRGIAAGFGPYLRNVVISANMVRGADIGIAVSVVEGAGAVRIQGNLLADILDHPVAGLAWDEVVEPELIANAGRYPNVSVG